MRRFTRWALCLGLCLGLTVCGALAAESGIRVQLDGRDLVFTDAAPQVRDQRTFLPFRAVFEAMGAEVDYLGDTVTAVRGDKTLVMTVGSTTATVTEGGAARAITMDVAPYVDPALWRTYVPVRFAAQAFGCAVGWDPAAQTAVIVDVETLTAQAKAGKTYSYLEQIAAMNGKYSQGLWDMELSFDAFVDTMAARVMTAKGTAKGAVEDNAKVDMSAHMTADLTKLAEAISLRQLPDETLAMLDFLKNEGVGLAVRGNLDSGKVFMHMDAGALGAQTGLDAAAWYELDMASLMAQQGVNWGKFMTTTGSADLLDALASTLTAAEPNSAATGYTGLKTSLETLFSAFSDDKFTKTELGAYEAVCALSQDLEVAIDVTEADGRVSGYMVTVNGRQGAGDQLTTFQVTASQTAEGELTAIMKVRPRAFDLTVILEGRYTPGTKAPTVAPPAGSQISPFHPRKIVLQ